MKFLLSKIFLINFLIAILILISFVWLSMSYLDSYTHHGESITVPNLKELDVSQVDELLKDKKLNYKITDSTYKDNVPPLSVIDQSPEPLSKVKQNRTIYLTVNATNPPIVKMPNLKDVSLRQAIPMLESIGLKVGELIYKPDLARNAVIEQQIRGREISQGAEIRKGTTIDLVLGNGLGNTEIPVPNLMNLTLNEAKFVLQGSSLNVGAVYFEKTVNDTSQAVIFRQTPEYSEKAVLSMGESVDIFLKEKSTSDLIPKN